MKKHPLGLCHAVTAVPSSFQPPVSTQAAGSNPLAGRSCGQTTVTWQDGIALSPSDMAFYLVSGEDVRGIEGDLELDSERYARTNDNPCP